MFQIRLISDDYSKSYFEQKKGTIANYVPRGQALSSRPDSKQ
jgi:hypothetical protein